MNNLGDIAYSNRLQYVFAFSAKNYHLDSCLFFFQVHYHKRCVICPFRHNLVSKHQIIPTVQTNMATADMTITENVFSLWCSVYVL